MERCAAWLSQSVMFNGLDDREIDTLVPLFSRRVVTPGDILARAGQGTQFFFLLEHGTLLLTMEMEGDRAVVLNTPGDFAGLLMVSLNGTNRATITVLESGAVWGVPCRQFLDLTRHETPMADTIMAGWQQFFSQKAPFFADTAEADIA